MKKIIMGVLFVIVSISAETIKSSYSLSITNSTINKNNSVLVDCSYKLEKRFYIWTKKVYKEYSTKQDFFSKLCRNKPNNVSEIKIHSIISLINKEFEDKINYYMQLVEWYNPYKGEAYYFIKDADKINNKLLLEKLPALAFRISFSNEENDGYYRFPVIKLNGSNNITFEIQRTKPIDFKKEIYKTITSYEYNIDKKKISKLGFKKPFNIVSKDYTNTYNIDNLRECIDGKIWIKKYGNTAGDRCPWIEVKNNHLLKVQ